MQLLIYIIKKSLSPFEYDRHKFQFSNQLEYGDALYSVMKWSSPFIILAKKWIWEVITKINTGFTTIKLGRHTVAGCRVKKYTSSKNTHTFKQIYCLLKQATINSARSVSQESFYQRSRKKGLFDRITMSIESSGTQRKFTFNSFQSLLHLVVKSLAF